MINIDTQHTIIGNFLSNELFVKYSHCYPVDWIKEYCSDPSVSEHESSLYGNYSAPTHLYNTDINEFLEPLIPSILGYAYGTVNKYDHFYINFHYDESDSFLEPHNDLKDFRWLITNQIYINENVGARLLSRNLVLHEPIPCYPNTFYNIVASPWSWHDVPDVKTAKKSILFRIGKRRHNSIAHLCDNDNTGWIIYNNFHADSHYAKLGHRMGNLTEAWLHSLGAKNIYHTAWRNEDNLASVIKKAVKRHTAVRIILSGYLPSTLAITDNSALQTVTDANRAYEFDSAIDIKDYHRLTDDNINEYADIVFSLLENDHPLSIAERTMYNYYNEKLHMNYVDLF